MTITEIEIRRMKVDIVITRFCAYELAGLIDTVKELREKQRQLENNEISVEDFDEYWQLIEMTEKLMRDY